SLFALLDKADVESGGITYLALPTDFHAGQREHHPIVVGQKCNVVVSSAAMHSEVPLPKRPSFRDVRYRKIKVIQFHERCPRRQAIDKEHSNIGCRIMLAMSVRPADVKLQRPSGSSSRWCVRSLLRRQGRALLHQRGWRWKMRLDDRSDLEQHGGGFHG